MSYSRRSSFRPIAKWAGPVMCAIIVVAGCWSSREDRVPFVYFSPFITASLYEGRLTIWTYPNRTLATEGGWRYCPEFHEYNRLHRYGFNLPSVVHEQRSGNHWLVRSSWTWYIRLPFWLLWLTFAIPTAILWHRDRQSHKPNHCEICGYNLTGNESGICPECATPVPKQEKTT